MEQWVDYVRNFEFERGNPWVCVASSTAYLVSVLAFRAVFDRVCDHKLELRFISAFHNIVLTLLSGVMFIGTIVGMAERIMQSGFYDFVFGASSGVTHGTLGFTLYVYYWSKYVEFFDTFLMVVKKRPLTLLHVWHHFIICPLTYLWLWDNLCLAWVGFGFNTFIHVFMYSYYVMAQLLNYQPWWKIYITSTQILQFFTVLLTICFWFATMAAGIMHDHATWRVMLISQAVNLTFLYLFVDFYRREYIQKRKRTAATKKATGKTQ
eukprot:TRINITY_DN662_c2_g1_i1.p2 TRINITY_DN662_c2_g1~~TRINITY_DN662_c2_g1_i1.p2  ORF type:complete len:265 (-),score=80.14 TRINITY_DN662_c2_g1_i1:24-818(-)